MKTEKIIVFHNVVKMILIKKVDKPILSNDLTGFGIYQLG